MLAEEYAVQSLPDGRYVIGYGPFESASRCPEHGVAFYVNDFLLTSDAGWKIPARYEVVDHLPEGNRALCKVAWEKLDAKDFTQVFNAISDQLESEKLIKSVPVVTEQGKVTDGAAAALCRKLAEIPQNFMGYAWVHKNGGFCGMTPEVLFRLRKGRLQTMALAGTARAEDREVFEFDEKEIREHEFVVETLVQRLATVGMVRKGVRTLLDLGSLVHFHTPMEIFLYGDHNFNKLIELLHPTPALGPLPRSKNTLEDLEKWRKDMSCPECFGAPFGVFCEGELFVLVAIRGVHWEGDNVRLPAGCGVIKESRLMNEWRELRLKRESVKKLWGIN